jgi:hypothetical protein
VKRTATCPVCSASFETRRDSGKYCSLPCSAKAQRRHDDRSCDRCGAAFVARWANARFCSAPCRVAAQREGNRRPTLDRTDPEPDAVPGARWVALGRGRFGLVDADDFARAEGHSWTCVLAGGKAYGVSRVAGRLTYLHRFILDEECPPRVDHENGDGLDCRRVNLRACNASQNASNRRKSRGTSRFKGVHWSKRHGCWRARIMVAGRDIPLGLFQDEEQAACAYDDAAREAFGSFGVYNFPLPGEQAALRPSADKEAA